MVSVHFISHKYSQLQAYLRKFCESPGYRPCDLGLAETALAFSGDVAAQCPPVMITS